VRQSEEIQHGRRNARFSRSVVEHFEAQRPGHFGPKYTAERHPDVTDGARSLDVGQHHFLTWFENGRWAAFPPAALRPAAAARAGGVLVVDRPTVDADIDERRIPYRVHKQAPLIKSSQ
jgi:hypothetical protein